MAYISLILLGKLKHAATVEFDAPIEFNVFCKVTAENPEGILLTKAIFTEMNVSKAKTPLIWLNYLWVELLFIMTSPPVMLWLTFRIHFFIPMRFRTTTRFISEVLRRAQLLLLETPNFYFDLIGTVQNVKGPSSS